VHVSARELVVLGTASQVPTRTRNHNGYLLRWDDAVLLFDPGEGTQRQLTYAGESAASITHVCVTHAHGDHYFGLPGVLQRIRLDRGVDPPVQLVYPAAAHEEIAAVRLLAGVDPLDPFVQGHPVADDGVVVSNRSWRLVAKALDHRVPTVGYRVEEPDGRTLLPERLAERGVAGPDVGRLHREGVLEVRGERIELTDVSEPRRGQVFAFVMDTRRCDAAVELARGADLLVCESTFLEAEAGLARAYGHLTARQAAEIARDAGAHQLVLTHFSQRYGDDLEPYVREARAVFPDVVAVRDLDRVPLPPRRRWLSRPR
jgi:ribonuclease Z